MAVKSKTTKLRISKSKSTKKVTKKSKFNIYYALVAVLLVVVAGIGIVYYSQASPGSTDNYSYRVGNSTYKLTEGSGENCIIQTKKYDRVWANSVNNNDYCDDTFTSPRADSKKHKWDAGTDGQWIGVTVCFTVRNVWKDLNKSNNSKISISIYNQGQHVARSTQDFTVSSGVMNNYCIKKAIAAERIQAGSYNHIGDDDVYVDEIQAHLTVQDGSIVWIDKASIDFAKTDNRETSYGDILR